MRRLLWLACVAVAAKGTHSHVDTAYTERGDAGSALHRRLQTCDPSSWPDLDWYVCGACKALVNWNAYGSTCGGYCSDDAGVVCDQTAAPTATPAPTRSPTLTPAPTSSSAPTESCSQPDELVSTTDATDTTVYEGRPNWPDSDGSSIWVDQVHESSGGGEAQGLLKFDLPRSGCGVVRATLPLRPRRRCLPVS